MNCANCFSELNVDDIVAAVNDDDDDGADADAADGVLPLFFCIKEREDALEILAVLLDGVFIVDNVAEGLDLTFPPPPPPPAPGFLCVGGCLALTLTAVVVVVVDDDDAAAIAAVTAAAARLVLDDGRGVGRVGAALALGGLSLGGMVILVLLTER